MYENEILHMSLIAFKRDAGNFACVLSRITPAHVCRLAVPQVIRIKKKNTQWHFILYKYAYRAKLNSMQ